jgi:hypothetical protein
MLSYENIYKGMENKEYLLMCGISQFSKIIRKIKKDPRRLHPYPDLSNNMPLFAFSTVKSSACQLRGTVSTV